MVDRDVVGCNWIELPPGKYRLRPEQLMGEPPKELAKVPPWGGSMSGGGISGM